MRGRSLGLLEKTIVALQVVGHLAESGLPFQFKGGSSLLLRLHPTNVTALREMQIAAPWSPLNRLKGGNPEAFHYWHRAQSILRGDGPQQ
jgi:hypothetical protein